MARVLSCALQPSFYSFVQWPFIWLLGSARPFHKLSSSCLRIRCFTIDPRDIHIPFTPLAWLSFASPALGLSSVSPGVLLHLSFPEFGRVFYMGVSSFPPLIRRVNVAVPMTWTSEAPGQLDGIVALTSPSSFTGIDGVLLYSGRLVCVCVEYRHQPTLFRFVCWELTISLDIKRTDGATFFCGSSHNTIAPTSPSSIHCLYSIYKLSSSFSFTHPHLHISGGMQTLAAWHKSQTALTICGASLIRVAFIFLVFFPHHAERIVLLTLETLALFTFPLCLLAYCSHAHAQMQTKRLTGSDPSFAQMPFPPPLPFSSRPPVFAPPPLIVPEKISGNDCAFISCAPAASSYTYVPTIPRVPVFHSRNGMPAAAPLPPPLSPPPLPPIAASADYIGPLHPVLTDGKHQFHVEGLIATGGYGRVALATVKGVGIPSSKVAIKVYCKDKLITNRLLLETYDLERAIMLENTMEDCQWLVKLRGTFGDLWNRYLVMDYYPNTLSGIIFDPKVIPLPRYIVRHWVEELTLGMYELYNRAIVHCDLKPGNILVSPKGHLAIADFGISVIADDTLDADKPFDECDFISYGGTYAYQAPELLISHHAVSFTCAADMWSFGVIIFEMYTNRRLFSADALDVRNEVWAWDIPTIVRSEIEDELAQDLVIALLEVEPEKRLKLRDVDQHPYFRRTNWTKVTNRSISIDFNHAELSSRSWRDSLRFEKPATPDSLLFGSS